MNLNRSDVTIREEFIESIMGRRSTGWEAEFLGQLPKGEVLVTSAYHPDSPSGAFGALEANLNKSLGEDIVWVNCQ